MEEEGLITISSKIIPLIRCNQFVLLSPVPQARDTNYERTGVLGVHQFPYSPRDNDQKKGIGCVKNLHNLTERTVTSPYRVQAFILV